MAFSKSCVVVVTVLQIPVNLIEVCAWDSPREIRQGEEIAWYADGETILRNEYNPSIAYAYGIICKTDIYGYGFCSLHICSFGMEGEAYIMSMVLFRLNELEQHSI